MKQLIGFAFIALTCILFFSCGQDDFISGNLVINGGFESLTGDIPDGWRLDVFESRTGRRVLVSADVTDPHSGTKSIGMENIDKADSKLIQRIGVMPNTYYKVSAWIKEENSSEKTFGANISVLPLAVTAQASKEESGKWQFVALYGLTGPDQNYIDVACRIGMYSNEETGKARFDDFEVRALKGLPANVQFQKFFEDAGANVNAGNATMTVQAAKDQTKAEFWIVLWSIAFILLFVFIYHTFLKKDRFGLGNGKRKVFVLFIGTLVFAFLLRIGLSFFLPSMDIDVSLYKFWGNSLLGKPWSEYYDYFSAYNHPRQYNQTIHQFFCDYPPVYVMILGFVAFVRNLFGFDEHMFTILIKSTNIICDLLSCILIYRIARRKLNEVSALGLAIAYAFNPAVIVNSAIWGQADSIYTLLAFLIVEAIHARRFWLGGLVLAFALLIKVQTAFIAFALLFALAEEKKLRHWALAIGVGIGSFILLILPFAIKLPPDWIIVQLIGTLTGYPYATVNAYNLFALFGANWRASGAPFLFGISSDIWGITLGYIFLVFSAFIYFYSREKSKNYYSGLLTITVIFLFIPGMHERYLYAAAIFSLMAYVYERDKRFLFLLLGFSLTIFINVYHILDVFIVGGLANLRIPDYPDDPLQSPFMLVTAVANLLLFFYMLYVGVDIYILKKVKLLKERVRVSEIEPVTATAGGETSSESTEAVVSEKIVDTGIPETPAGGETKPLEDPAVIREETPRPRSRFGSVILAIGILSAFIPTFSFVAWLIGHRELKRFPDDAKVRAGWALGVGIVVIFVTGFVFALILFPGLKSAGYIK